MTGCTLVNGSFEKLTLENWTHITVGSMIIYPFSEGMQRPHVFKAQSGTGWGMFELSRDIDLTNVNSITFYGGGYFDKVITKIDTQQVVVGSRNMSGYTKYTIDTQQYTGVHTLSFYMGLDDEPNIVIAIDDVELHCPGIITDMTKYLPYIVGGIIVVAGILLLRRR